MSKEFILLAMIFCHIVDDFYLQKWLASAKQKSWWSENAPDVFYQYDYIWALLTHAFSWSFMIMLPIAFNMSFAIDCKFVIMLLINLVTHAFVDDLKANKKAINLCLDQTIHLCQIVLTACMFV